MKVVSSKYSKGLLITFLVTNLLLSFILIIGGSFYYGSSINLFNAEKIGLNIAFFIFVFLLLSFVTFLCLLISKYGNYIIKRVGEIRNNKLIWILFPILFTVYSVVYLTYFPGILAYDTSMQIPQALGLEPLNGHHPIFHTLIIRICMKIGSWFSYAGAGIVIYSLLQIIVFSWGLTYIVYIVSCEYKYRLVPILIGVSFAVYPTFALFSFNITKDVLFSVFFNLFTIRFFLLIKHFSEASRKDKIETFIYAILLGQFRNNAIYVLFILFVILLFTKKHRKAGLMFSFVPFLICMALNFFLFNIVGLQGSPPQEKIPVPIHQIEAVYIHCNTELDSETKSLIVDYLPQISWYNPSNVDIVKEHFNQEKYNDNHLEFWKLWFELGKDHPLEYLKSGLELNMEFWYPFHTYNNEFRDMQYVETAFNSFTIEEIGKVERKQFLPELYNWLEKYANCQFPIMNNWFLGFIFSISFPFFFMYMSLLHVITRKKYPILLFFAPYILLWLTYIIGPISNVRYMLPFFILIPYGLIMTIEETEV